MELKRTELYDWHVKMGGTMVPFAGWEMPIQYSGGAIGEHRHVRTDAGLFDIDHMGQIFIEGENALPYLNSLVTADLSTLAVGSSTYSLLCLPSGGVIDDLFIYRLPTTWMVVVNASNREKDFNWFCEKGKEYPNVKIEDRSDPTYMIALQGPKAIAILDSLTQGRGGAIPRFSSATLSIFGKKVLIGRTGYTGEDGVELFFDRSYALKIWEGIIEEGRTLGITVSPIGLAARDSLRFEPGFPLYGHELTESILPVEARLKWACALDKKFVGREAILSLLDRGLERKLVSFELLDKGVPREDYKVLNCKGEEIGYVMTGLYAPWIDKYCGNALVSSDYVKKGTEIFIEIRKKRKRAIVVARPMFKPTYRK